MAMLVHQAAMHANIMENPTEKKIMIWENMYMYMDMVHANLHWVYPMVI